MLPRSGRLRALLLAVPAAALLIALIAGGSAGAEVPAPAPENGKDVVKMVLKGGKLKFEAPSTVYEGDELEVLNETNPRQVGPHTFSLVEKGLVPKTKSAQKSCFTPKHICLAIAEWHKLNPKTEKVGLNPVKAGPAGWSTMGNLTKTGDSWFTGETKSGTHFSQTVTAKAGTTLYFICAVHPWMHGQVKVLAKPPA
jgi:plastocyanin